MILQHEGRAPVIHPDARIAPNATLCGDVTIGAGVSIGFGAVIVAESGPVTIGEHSIVMDTAVLRGVRGNPLSVGRHVMIGPRCSLSGCTIDDNAFIATGAAVFNGARIGEGAEVRINGVVHIRTVLPPGATVPIGWVAVGDPAQVFSPDQHDEIWAIQKTLQFPQYVFGIDRPPPGQSMMPTVMPRYARKLAAHRGDTRVG